MKLRTYFISALTILTSLAFIAEDEILNTFLQNFEKHSQNHLQEKIYLHTDKPYYAIGDEIWFKTYLVDAQTMRPSAHSNIMYVELINDADSLIKTLKLPLATGFGWGNFTLTDSLSEGNYRIRAYTQWMRNFSQDFFYDHSFKVGDARSSQLITETHFEYLNDGEVKANINYKNMDGEPYADKSVTYQIETAGDKIIAKGSGQTDQSGNLIITYNSKSEKSKKGLLSTTISISENTSINKLIPIHLAYQTVDVQFFPEGGDLVNEVKSKIAFKAVGMDGKGKNLNGFIQNNLGEKVATLSTTHLGMGSFSLTPKADETYEAVIQIIGEAEKKIALPKAKEQGVVLTVGGATQKDSLVIRLSANAATLSNNPSCYLIGQASGAVVFTAKLPLKRASTYLMIAKKDFPTGIAHFTIFNNLMMPLAERLAFIYHDDFLKLDVAADKSTYTNRGKTNLAIKAFDKNGKPAVGSFSMSVINEDLVASNPNEEHTLYSELLLSSDLRGKVEQPNYYFNDTNDKKLEELDLLMLTQGWRRFNWKDIQDKKESLAYQAEQTLNISGRVLFQKKPAANVQVTAFSSSGGANTLQTKTNSKGEFRFDSLLFVNEAPFMLSAGTAKDKKQYVVEFSGNYKPTTKLNKPLENNINLSMQGYLTHSRMQYEELLKNGLVSNSYLLKEVKITAAKVPLVKSSSNLNGPGNADLIITNKELVEAPNLATAILARVPGSYIESGGIYLKRNLGLSLSSGPIPMLTVIDGMPSGGLLDIHPRDIASIEFLKTISLTSIYGVQGNNGVLVVTTRRGGNNTESIANPRILNINATGYTLAKEFYSPVYDLPETRKDLKDVRSTIYWNPNIQTDVNGIAPSINYFNADVKGIYKVVIEGIDLNGHLGRKVMRYMVK